MDFDLKEIATTLAIGVFVIFGSEFIILSFFGRVVSSKIANKLETSRFVVGALAASLCFVTGMIVENVSNRLVDDESWLRLDIYGLESDHWIKRRILFEGGGTTSLAHLAAKHGLLGEFGRIDGEALENNFLKVICDPEDYEILNQKQKMRDIALEKVSLDNAAKRFYYNAKSVVYRNQFYYDELKRIQMRIDFSRSLIAACLVLMIVVTGLLFFKSVVLGLLRLVKGRPRKETSLLRRFHVWLRTLRDSFEKPNIRLGRLFMAYLVLGVIFTLSIFAYKSEEEEFDKRTYGYYLSLKIDSKDSPAEARCKEKVP